VEEDIMTGNLLDGPSQYTLVAVALAAVAYIRSNPYKQLMDKLAKLPKIAPVKIQEREEKEKELKDIHWQTILLDVVQILLAFITVGLLGREIKWHGLFDFIILALLLGIAVVLLALHLKYNGRAIKKALERWHKPWESGTGNLNTPMGEKTATNSAYQTAYTKHSKWQKVRNETTQRHLRRKWPSRNSWKKDRSDWRNSL
jgi:hypothetical protein